MVIVIYYSTTCLTVINYIVGFYCLEFKKALEIITYKTKFKANIKKITKKHLFSGFHWNNLLGSAI